MSNIGMLFAHKGLKGALPLSPTSSSLSADRPSIDAGLVREGVDYWMEAIQECSLTAENVTAKVINVMLVLHTILM